MTTVPHIHFSPILDGDLRVLHQWLQNDHVREFWDDGDRTLEQVKNHYKPEKGIERYLFYIDGQPAGYFQSYLVEAGNEYLSFSLSNKKTIGIDFFIGNIALLNKGYAIHVLAAFIKEYCQHADRVLVDPQPTNHKAIHLYKKYGFMKIGEQVIHDKPYWVMGINLRRTVRAIVFNSKNEILLMHVSTWAILEDNTRKNNAFWCTLGGRIEKGEKVEEALTRELYEEAGITDFRKIPFAFGEQVLVMSEFSTRLIEMFYAVHMMNFAIQTANLTEEEKEVVKEYRWWSLENLKNSKETIFPGCLYQIAMKYLKNPTEWRLHEINLD